MGNSVGDMSASTYVVAGEVVDGSLGQHAVVLELTLAERRSVASDDDQLGLAGSEALEGGLVAKSDWKKNRQRLIPMRARKRHHVPFPDFITSANLELMLLASFLLFLTGAILTDWCSWTGDLSLGDGGLRFNLEKFVEFGSFGYARWAAWRGRAATRLANEAAHTSDASPKGPKFRRRHHAEEPKSCFEIKLVG